MAQLIIKNIGPIKDINITLNKVNRKVQVKALLTKLHAFAHG